MRGGAQRIVASIPIEFPVPLQASQLAQLINFVCTRPDSGTIKLRAVVFISGRSRPAGSTTGAARLARATHRHALSPAAYRWMRSHTNGWLGSATWLEEVDVDGFYRELQG